MRGEGPRQARVQTWLDPETTARLRRFVEDRGVKQSLALLGISMVTLYEARQGGRMQVATADRIRRALEEHASA